MMQEARRSRWWVWALLMLPTVPGLVQAQAKVEVLNIGSSGTLSAGAAGAKEKSALETLRGFIKEETGFENQIVREKDWQTLVDKMAKGTIHLGVFQGYEFAWAKEAQPKLRPLAVAVNVHRYPVAYVLVNKDNEAKDFAGLKGQTLALPGGGLRFLRLYTEQQSLTAGAKLDAFFGKVTTPENIEDALDDVVDGTTQAVAADQAALEAYKRRKPGRFKNLRPIAHSAPLPPPVIAAYDKVLDEATLNRFRDGLLNASQKDRGQTMLTLFRLTGFEAIPQDFDTVLTDSRKTYPPSISAK